MAADRGTLLPLGLGAVFLALAVLVAPARLFAEDAPSFRIEMKDGVITPQRLEVPAGKRFLIEITNSGSSPAEFESRDLKKEVVLAPGDKSTLVIKKLDPGEYTFFDDFHPGVTEVLVAK